MREQMPRVILFTSAAALFLKATGAVAATPALVSLASHSSTAPHPSLVAVFALVGMGFLVLMARAPMGKPADMPQSAPLMPRFNWKGLLTVWPNQRAAYALLAVIAVSGSLGLA
jgi:hypothetical protein